MKTTNARSTLFGIIGAVAALINLPFLYGVFNLSQKIYFIAPGFIFGLVVAVPAAWLDHGTFSHQVWRSRYIFGGILVAAGMPLAIAAGAASMTIADRVWASDKFHLGGIGGSFFFGEIVSCIVWSAVIFAWTLIINRTRAFQILRIAPVIIVSIMLFANLIEVVSKTLWQKSLLLVVISITEQVGSAIILSIGSKRDTRIEQLARS